MVEVCKICGERGFSNALLYCSECSDSSAQQYCLGIPPPRSINENFPWICECCSVPKESEYCRKFDGKFELGVLKSSNDHSGDLKTEKLDEELRLEDTHDNAYKGLEDIHVVASQGIETAEPLAELMLYEESGVSELLNKVVNNEAEAYCLYNDYAFKHGFGVRRGKTIKNTKNKITVHEFVCDKNGLKRKKDEGVKFARAETRTNCKARLRFRVMEDGKYLAVTHDMVHNHPMVPEDKTHLIRSHRKVSRQAMPSVVYLYASGAEALNRNASSPTIREKVDVCEICGQRGFLSALLRCSECSDSSAHQYCLGIPPRSIDDNFRWICECCSVPKESECCPKFDDKFELGVLKSCKEHSGDLKTENVDEELRLEDTLDDAYKGLEDIHGNDKGSLEDIHTDASQGIETVEPLAELMLYEESGVSELLNKVVNNEVEAYCLYNDYAFKHGFGVRRGKTHKNTKNEITVHEFVCDKNGLKRKKDEVGVNYVRADTRTNCKARLRFHVFEDGKYLAVIHDMVHNHPMVPKDKRHLIRSHRKVSRQAMPSVVYLYASGVEASSPTSSNANEVPFTVWGQQTMRKFASLIFSCQNDEKARKLVDDAYDQLRMKLKNIVHILDDDEEHNEMVDMNECGIQTIKNSPTGLPT